MIKLIKNMYKKTKFHTKLLITYSSIVILILIVLSVFFYRYAYIMLEGSVKKSFEQTAFTIKKRIDYSLGEMNGVADRIKENSDLKNELHRYNQENSEVGNRFTYSVWMKKILLDALSIDSEIYRISVFNEKGDFLSTSEHIYESKTLSEIVTNSQWYKELSSGKAKEYILEPHYDDWLTNRHIMVYSIIKPIILYDEVVGFVEVQRRANEYSEITAGVDNGAIIAVVKNNGKVFYSSKKLFSKTLINHYLDIAGSRENGIQIKPNPFSNIQEMVAFARSKNGWTAFVIQNYSKTLEPLQSVKNIFLIAVLIITILSIVFIYIFSRKLTVPLRKLKDNIETVNMSNLNKSGTANDIFEHNEIEAINESFLEMQKRLKDAMETEIKSRSLQVKAHFDALQARINPHFIFNMLGVIANMSEEAEQDEIASVCKKLAKMLRYSTKSSDALTTMKEEIEHAQDYLALMKNRFEHRLEYKIDVDDRLMAVTVPKFIVQPLIENSIAHGFNDSPVEVMRIEISGKVVDDDKWEMNILDNGSGFKTDILDHLNERIVGYKERILKYEKPEELSIGGMGVVNTFVRLGLYFGEKAEFEIKNMEPGGALITIRCPMFLEE